ncbi:hypothetical protein Poly30_52450 [Planctomycetes bacterium Poly30]|uniref:LITAF domain-containing protein n=1 Tax=Saltatorellus ferox TaxID=2528018 RepID=A0A518F025_9BACT|nr:hypothetical protein Poly30_52450 [Planctomycetes bacterium Poly30]
MPTAINENVIRWSAIRLPHPSRPGQLVTWKVDGPFALRSYYRLEDTKEVIQLDLSHRREDGTIERCLHCGGTPLQKAADRPWGPIGLLAVVGLGLAPFTFGLTALAAAYPIWFLWSSSPVTQTCTTCKAEFVDFRFGPRP